MGRSEAPVCDRDCFNCRYDDCICDDMAAYQRKYYKANREAIAAKRCEYRETNREAIAAYQRKYYKANREAIVSKQRKYYEANREAIIAYQREYRKANRGAISAKQREYYKANREVHVSAGRTLRMARRAMGYSQMALAQIVGVTQPLISLYECGKVPFPDDLFRDVLPALKEDMAQ